MQLIVAEKHLSAFIACLAMGTLHSIRAGALPPQAGIWTLGLPSAWVPLLNRPAVSEQLIDVLQRFD